MTSAVTASDTATRYRVLREIATGGMGEVVLAHDTVLDRKVVIKYLRESLAEDPEFVDLFLEEGRAMARCDHPNIVRIFDLGRDDERFFMALEWLHGWDLQQISKRALSRGQHLPLPIALSLLIEACLGLHAAHEARTAEGRPLHLVHRDVSPNNLFVTTSGVLKVLDFGIVKTRTRKALTQVGQVRGKASYMSPEQCRGDKLDRRSDVFALGIVLHEILSGHRLFKRGDPLQTYKAVAQDPIAKPARAGAALPEALVALTMRALEREPSARPATAKALADALTAILDGLGPRPNRDDIANYVIDLFPDAPVGVGVDPNSHEPTDMALRSEPVDDGMPELDAADVIELDAELIESSTQESQRGARPMRWRWAVIGTGAGLLALWLVFAARSGGDGHAIDATTIAEKEPVAVTPAIDKPKVGEPEVAAPTPTPTLAPTPTPVPADAYRTVESAPGPVLTAPAVVASPRKPKPREVRPASSSSSSATGTGRLTLQSVPWANVYVDGKLMGPTPLVELELPAGPIKVRLVNPELGVDRTETITIPRGKTVKRRVELQAR